jgi:16S rRNA (guanine527-N7)-methyltransferase
MPDLLQQFEAHRGKIPPVRPDELALYAKHFSLLQHWNEQFNLVSRNAFEKAFANHYLDSIFVADTAAALAEGRPLIDIGSGAGFPGLILAIRYPKLSIRLFEKSLKKQTFLSTAVVQLGLANVQVNGLFEEKNTYALVVARAVFPPDKIFKFMGAHLKPKSRLVFQRGGQSEAPKVPPYFKSIRSEKYDLPLDCGSRFAEVFELVPRGTK